MNANITPGKIEGLNACANERGVFAALAVDHRDNLMQAIAESRGPGGQASAAGMLAFKPAVTQVLTPYASAILLDPVYDDALGDEKGPAFARIKPAYVLRAIGEFSRPRYSVDVLKVELPVNPAYVSGTRAFTAEQAAYSRQEAMEHFRATAGASPLP